MRIATRGGGFFRGRGGGGVGEVGWWMVGFVVSVVSLRATKCDKGSTGLASAYHAATSSG